MYFHGTMILNLLQYVMKTFMREKKKYDYSIRKKKRFEDFYFSAERTKAVIFLFIYLFILFKLCKYQELNQDN